MSYDPFGKRRQVNGTYDAAGNIQYDYPNSTDRGFTGHEHLDDVGVLHMNGRTYDPHIGRFMQTDPVIQDNSDLQNYNRYSYVLNNPLNSTDPTGHKFSKLLGALICPFCVKEWQQPIATMVVAYFTGQWVTGLTGSAIAGGAAGGFTQGMIASGGDIEAGLRSAVIGGAFGAVGTNFEAGTAGSYAGHAAVGCVDGAMSGNGCGRGAASALVAKTTTNYTQDWNNGARFVAAAVTGGTTSVIGGGKFENGATTAAFGYLFNFMSSKWQRALVPGQVQFDNGMTAIEEGRYGAASLHFGAMLGEQVATVLTFGEHGAASAAARASAAQWESRFVFQTEHIARHLEGTALSVDGVKQAIMQDLRGASYQTGQIIKRDIVVNLTVSQE